ncbi:ammonium transporter [Companilactobacillus furfuricola]|uniref:ammonium transporter n=1 Tax=Companilactobacillus furfuricola TaxID=1462575 RepID=UPI000F79E853|nr:ammonium transporter [Companilactobacillus furfuricola]
MDSAFMILSILLVWVMTPGIAAFYGGFIPRKDTTKMLFEIFLMFGVIGLLWFMIGYPLSFEGNNFGIIGDLKHIFLSGINLSALYPKTNISNSIFILFQMMFAILTPGLFLGSIATKKSTKYIVAFVAIWSILVYYPLVHMVWDSTGFLAKLGVLDFAGGTVIHIDAGVTALILSNFAISKHIKKEEHAEKAKGNPFWVLIGTVLLWIGWYGFNAGSALALSPQGVQAFFTTTMAPITAMLTYGLLENHFKGKATMNGICTGVICGLVGITPATGFVTLPASLIIGVVSAAGSYLFINKLKYIWHINDYMDIMGAHGVSGILGSVMTGLFATNTINPNVAHNGLLEGGGLTQLGIQVFAVLFSFVFVFVVNFVIVKVLKVLFRESSSRVHHKVSTLHV